jgi:hypothetical protein
MMDKALKRMEELEEVAKIARQQNINSQHDQAPLPFADDFNMGRQVREDEEVNMGEHAVDTGRPDERRKPQDDEDDSGGHDICMGGQLMDTNQPVQALKPEREKINTGGHAMNTGRTKEGKESLDDDEDNDSEIVSTVLVKKRIIWLTPMFLSLRIVFKIGAVEVLALSQREKDRKI